VLTLDWSKGVNRYSLGFDTAIEDPANLNAAVRNTTVAFIHLEIQLME
jgi:hypothetical protein